MFEAILDQAIEKEQKRIAVIKPIMDVIDSFIGCVNLKINPKYQVFYHRGTGDVKIELIKNPNLKLKLFQVESLCLK